MEGMPEFVSMPPEVTDLDRLRERLERERFIPAEYPAGTKLEIESVVYPEWYVDGQKLLGELDGHRVSDSELRDIAEVLGFNLDRILGIDTEAEDVGAVRPDEALLFRSPDHGF